MNDAKILIIYNANEGWSSALMDAVHKVARPGTYACSLCMVSYGVVSMRAAWRNYLESLPYKKHFYHRQDFARAYPSLAHLPLPAILLDRNGTAEPLLDKGLLDAINSVDELITATDLAISRMQT